MPTNARNSIAIVIVNVALATGSVGFFKAANPTAMSTMKAMSPAMEIRCFFMVRLPARFRLDSTRHNLD